MLRRSKELEPACRGCAAELPVSDQLMHYEGQYAVLMCTRFLNQGADRVSRKALIEEMANAVADLYGLTGETRTNAMAAFLNESEAIYDVLLILLGDNIRKLRR